MIALRLLTAAETDDAARQYRAAGALIPGFDPMERTLEETRAVYREVFAKGPIWGAFDGDDLVGHIALEPGWIEHLYVDPSRHGEGIGRLLLAKAMSEQTDLQLYTYAANVRARALYDKAGFVVVEHGFDPDHRDRMPNVRYRWTRPS